MRCKTIYMSVRRVAIPTLFAGAMVSVAVAVAAFAQAKTEDTESDEADT